MIQRVFAGESRYSDNTFHVLKMRASAAGR
jgi:hypothetical protein